LSAVVEGGHPKSVEALLSAGADVRAASGEKHWTALQVAVFRGHIEVEEKLRQREACQFVASKHGEHDHQMNGTCQDMIRVIVLMKHLRQV
jgi:ankyrin repeat protein